MTERLSVGLVLMRRFPSALTMHTMPSFSCDLQLVSSTFCFCLPTARAGSNALLNLT